jgi:hypothetical protein
MSGQLVYHPSGYLYDQYYDVFFDPRSMTAVHPSVVHHAMIHMASPMAPVTRNNSVNALTGQMRGVSIAPVYNIRYFVKEGGGERELFGGIREMIDMLRSGSAGEIIIRGVFDKQVKELVISPSAGTMELYMFNKKRNDSKGEQTFRLAHTVQGVDTILSYFLTNFHEVMTADERAAVMSRGGRRKTYYRNKKRPVKKRRTMKGK